MGEYVRLGHDDEIVKTLEENGEAIDTSSFTKMSITVDGVSYESTNQSSDPIKWNQGGYATGEIHIKLGDKTITPGFYVCPLYVYSPAYSNGILWKNFFFYVVADQEGEVPP